MKRSKKIKKKTRDSRYSKLSLFQKPDVKFFRPCPLSGKAVESCLQVLRLYH